MSAYSEHETAELQAATPAPGTSTDDAYGLLQWGPMVLALAVANLREVIACPDKLAPLPTGTPAVRSSVLLRGCIIPVLDLGQVLGLPAPDSKARVIVVMRSQGRLLGLLAGAVRGMARKRPQDLSRLTVTTAGGPSVATHSFEVEGEVATLLNADLMAALPGVPMVAEPVAELREHEAGVRQATLLFRVGDIPLGIDALVVDATVPRTALIDSPLKRGLCRGVVPHHGHEVPVVDTLALLGLGALPDCEESAVLVLRVGAGRIGLMIDQVQDIVQVAARQVMPVQAMGLAQPRLFRGMLAQHQHLLLDTQVLQGHELLASLASLSPRQGAGADSYNARQEGRNRGRSAAPYLTYLVGVEMASPLTQVSEILTYPKQVVPRLGGRHATLGLFEHQGTAMPLVCLATLRGQTVAWNAEQARVLIVEQAGQRVGLLVQALCTIEHARWEEPASAPGSKARGLPPLIEVGEGAQQRTLPRLDLPDVLRRLAG